MPPPPRIPDQWMDAKTFKDIEHFEIGSFKAKLRTDRDQIIKLQSSKVKKGKKIIEKINTIIQTNVRFRWLFSFWGIMGVLFRGNNQRSCQVWNVVTHFGATSNLFCYIIFFTNCQNWQFKAVMMRVFLEWNHRRTHM